MKQMQRLYHAEELYRPHIELVSDQQLVQISIRQMLSEISYRIFAAF
jgi:hypothetical protein